MWPVNHIIHKRIKIWVQKILWPIPPYPKGEVTVVENGGKTILDWEAIVLITSGAIIAGRAMERTIAGVVGIEEGWTWTPEVLAECCFLVYMWTGVHLWRDSTLPPSPYLVACEVGLGVGLTKEITSTIRGGDVGVIQPYNVHQCT